MTLITAVPPKRRVYRDDLTPEYYARFKAPDWEPRRQQLFAQQEQRCLGCQQVAELEAHHLTYVRFWDEGPYDLIGVCQDCHQYAHQLRSAGIRMYRSSGVWYSSHPSGIPSLSRHLTNAEQYAGYDRDEQIHAYYRIYLPRFIAWSRGHVED